MGGGVGTNLGRPEGQLAPLSTPLSSPPLSRERLLHPNNTIGLLKSVQVCTCSHSCRHHLHRVSPQLRLSGPKEAPAGARAEPVLRAALTLLCWRLSLVWWNRSPGKRPAPREEQADPVWALSHVPRAMQNGRSRSSSSLPSLEAAQGKQTSYLEEIMRPGHLLKRDAFRNCREDQLR